MCANHTQDVCMQSLTRRSNWERTETMRAALIRARRHLFAKHGFAGTATPDIVAMAGVTRGALYHHFADQEALFDAVIRQEADAVARAGGGRSGTARGAGTVVVSRI